MTKLQKSSAAKKSATGDPVIGGYIKAARLRAKITQEALAKELGVSKGLIAQWELGQTMLTVPYLVKLGSSLKCGTDALLNGARIGAQPTLPGMSIDDRIQALPEAMREFVILALQRAETAAKLVPSKFINAPTNENWPQFAAYLEAMSIMSNREEGE